ncbi:hypothetical protein [Yersinia massiliensis]|uniref:hypothetical protein n=1 Tax=Yersinia massiliensis TaxID=419257 RepID=UPI001CFD030A|nr:hypothetical protein [Yersinia massiliensis]MCB5310764.1 hypothetical protein [Yersinia massiliensis]
MLKLNSAATSRHVNTLTIDVDKDFDGRLMLYIDQGVLKNYEPVRSDMHVCTLVGFMELCSAAGYEISALNQYSCTIPTN